MNAPGYAPGSHLFDKSRFAAFRVAIAFQRRASRCLLVSLLRCGQPITSVGAACDAVDSRTLLVYHWLEADVCLTPVG